MTNEEIANAALEYVRSIYGSSYLKSWNKTRTNETPEHGLVRRDVVGPIISAARRSGPLAIAASVEETGAGNCLDLALLAFRHAVGLAPAAQLLLVMLVPPGDHAFLTVGGSLKDVLLPFDAFGKEQHPTRDYWICDPWANIACAGAEYESRFAAKMAEWSQAGRKITYQGVRIDPLHPAWCQSLYSNKRVDACPEFWG